MAQLSNNHASVAHNPDQYYLIMLKSLLQVVVRDNFKTYYYYGL